MRALSKKFHVEHWRPWRLSGRPTLAFIPAGGPCRRLILWVRGWRPDGVFGHFYRKPGRTPPAGNCEARKA